MFLGLLCNYCKPILQLNFTCTFVSQRHVAIVKPLGKTKTLQELNK